MLLYEFKKEECIDAYVYTKQNISKIEPLLQECDFKSVVCHLEVKAFPEQNRLSNEEIIQLLDEDKIDAPPLQADTVYIYCKLANDSVPPGPLRDALTSDLPLGYRSLSVAPTFPGGNSSVFDYFLFPLPNLSKHLIFKTSENSDIGWYNIHANILWLSDICNGDPSLQGLQDILQYVSIFRRTGHLVLPRRMTIGMDPEFEILYYRTSSSKIASEVSIPAHMLLPDNLLTEEIGHDGCTSTGELRPKYADHPLRLARNLKRTVRKLARHKELEPYVICAGGGLSAGLGGHIHVSVNIPTALRNALYDLIGKFVNKATGNSVRRYADQLVARNGSDAVRKAGGHEGDEWRNLPSFIVDEKVSKAVLCTTWVVVKSFYAGEITSTREDMTPIEVANILQNLTLYKLYQQHIDNFIKLFVQDTTKVKLDSIDIRKGWRIQHNVNNCNIVIISPIEWIRNNFKPICVDLPVSLKVLVEHCPSAKTLEIVSKFLPSSSSELIRKFAATHFIDCSTCYASYQSFDLTVRLPAAWEIIIDEDIMREQLGPFLQELIAGVAKRKLELSQGDENQAEE
jgi:hypothetical protein